MFDVFVHVSSILFIVLIISETLIGILRKRQTWDRYLIVLLTDHVLSIRRHIWRVSVETHALVEPCDNINILIVLYSRLCPFYSTIQSFFTCFSLFCTWWTCLFIRIELKCSTIFHTQFYLWWMTKSHVFFSISSVVLSWKELDEDTMHVCPFDVLKRITAFFK